MISSIHTVVIDQTQIDLYYDFTKNIFQCYVDGAIQVDTIFRPNHVALNYGNVVEVANYYYGVYLKRCEERHKAELRELNS